MNPNELMLGDLVYAGKNVIHVTAATIGLGKYEELKPIPLTEEILEKSGFCKWNEDEMADGEDEYRNNYEQDVVAVWEAQGKRIYDRMYVVFEKIGDRIVPVFEYYDDVDIPCVQGLFIYYAHQLQHVLRIINIEKEVVV